MRMWENRSVLEAASWRLASELVRRHPDTVRLTGAHPGGGQSDVSGSLHWEVISPNNRTTSDPG